MKFLDLFSGIGGFRLGLQRAGHTPVGYVEIDKFARQSYQAMYDTTGEWTAEDINKVTDEEWSEFNEKVELIAGGFPCQSFSIAGKREGFLNQTKGTLFFEVARAVKQIKPRFVFLENVKGLLNHDKGNTFRTILNTFDELGYDVEWRIYNSKDFGVPQNRERVYIIGHSRRDSGREVFPFFGEDGEVNQSTVKQLGNLSDSKSFGGNPQTGRVYSDDGLSPTLNTMQGGGREPKVAIPVLTPDRVNKRQNGRRFKDDGDPSFTLTSQDRHGVMVKEATKKGYDIATVGDNINISQPNSKTRRGRVGHGIANTLVTGSERATLTSEYRIRKLTPRECWRLQAFPDELFDKAQKAGLSDSQLYKQAGNSVTVNVIEYIGHLLEAKHEI
ncbi:DNA (cytosine-5-)-methyltransferase [Leuconostoc lactis]|uniref:DNA (cytosine-5-)-methyltransferase n=1 Tax=Leuconostoc lactis TaxID=1246 RepID=UPI0011BAE742|nr:DNA (cytosine-5-)-methyltransferase [Leuconostoc lactis]QEA50193.1 DNA (cytosine-5-)-methyltransferase [Leuconostoc lactis]